MEPLSPRPGGDGPRKGLRGWLFGQPYLLLTLTTMMWAGNAIAGRLAVGEISPMALTSLRWVIAAIVMGLVARREVIGALPVYGTRIRLLQVVGMAVTFAGVAVVATRGEVATLLGLDFNIGDVWML